MLIDRLLFSDKVPSLMRKSLDVETQRNLLISSNISNVDTPGYKASEIDFQKQLRDVLGSDAHIRLVSTHEKHFGASPDAVKNLKPEVFEEADPARPNGNNVDMDKEMAKLAENQIFYNAMIQLMMKRGSMVRSAINELPQG